METVQPIASHEHPYNKWLLFGIAIICLVVIATFITILLLPSSTDGAIVIPKHDNCKNRCGQDPDPSKDCQCNKYNYKQVNWCRDYFIECVDSVKGNVTDQEIALLSQEIWNADSDKVNVTLNLQGKIADGTMADSATLPLINGTTPADVFTESPIYMKLIALFDNYERNDSLPEDITESEWAEVDDFLTEAMKSKALRLTHYFLAFKGFVSSDDAAFQAGLRKIWYELYVRSGALSSSGAEHVQVGEVKDDLQISGLHNWVRFALLEQEGSVNYLGYVNYKNFGVPQFQTSVIRNPFFWDEFYKPVGGFFIGTSPAFDLSVYTLCFYVRPDSGSCTLNINGNAIKIQTYTMQYNGDIYVGSTYPNF